ncbi:MAG TPA: hypothetical protein PLI68_09760 [Bacteroidia bacterium]|nr:hypothetical protein [Bacteroidia bacterium]HRH07851.1 hypothetical protein [Bacteroidia bacterium]HRH63598.1 hypothetical protein [Bacteroidia bacterium]
MAKHLSLPKNGFSSFLDHSFFKLFSPIDKNKAAAQLNFVAAEIPTSQNQKANYNTELPSEEPRVRIKKDFQVSSEYQTQLKPDSKPKPEYAELKPEIKLMHTGFNVAVNFANNFKLTAKIYGRRGFEKEFKFLAMDTFSPYLDNRPKLDVNLSEEREYKVVFIDEEMEVGQVSEIVKITI